MTLPGKVSFDIDHVVAMRFFAKVALASSFGVFGTSWLSGGFAQTLRAIMRGQTPWDAPETSGSFVHSPFRGEGVSRTPIFEHPLDSTVDEHEVMFWVQDRVAWVGMTIFGVIGARFRVRDGFGSEGIGLGFGINFKTRGARRLELKAQA